MIYIHLDTRTAEALAVTLIAGNHGADVLAAQRLLETLDQNDAILVKGTPYQDFAKGHSFRASHVIFSKEDAEILDFGITGRLTLSPQQEKYWRNFMPPSNSPQCSGPDSTMNLGTTVHLCGCSQWRTAVSSTPSSS